MNLPNKLTLLRVCMIPVFVVLALRPAFGCQIAATLVFALASFTDMLDGKIARKRNLVTNFGKFADPIADKLLVMSAMIVMVGQGRIPSWVCVLILAREFVISGFRLVAVEGGRVIAAGKLGKLKIPVVECADYMEVSALARAEWIRFYGRLVGKAELADSIFRGVASRYQQLKQQAGHSSQRPRLICEAPYNGQWFMPAGGSPMGQMYADAGADYLFSDIPGTGSAPLSIEHVLERALGSEIWLVKTYGLQSKAQLVADTPLLRGIRAQVWTCDPYEMKFYEETPFHPDLLLENLVALLHPQLGISPVREYFHRVP